VLSRLSTFYLWCHTVVAPALTTTKSCAGMCDSTVPVSFHNHSLCGGHCGHAPCPCTPVKPRAISTAIENHHGLLRVSPALYITAIEPDQAYVVYVIIIIMLPNQATASTRHM
jgi:hypothetical protein